MQEDFSPWDKDVAPLYIEHGEIGIGHTDSLFLKPNCPFQLLFAIIVVVLNDVCMI